MTEEEADEESLDFDDEVEQTGPSTAVVVGSIGIALIVVIGAVGYLSGVGWFGYRQWLYGQGQLYLPNYSNAERMVSVDGREPLKLEPRTFEKTSVVGGTNSVRIMDANGETLSTHSLFADNSDAFFRVDGDACLVASNVTSFYESPEGKLEFVKFIRADQRAYVPGSYNVIWPGESFPPRLQAGEGAGIWIEKVGCNHLEHRDAMRTYLQVRLQDRMKSEEEAPTKRRPPPPGR